VKALEIRIALRATLAKYSPNRCSSILLNLPEGSLLEDVTSLLGIPQEEVYLVLVNDSRAVLSDKLQDCDRVELVPPIAGG